MKHAARRPTQLDFVVMALAPALVMTLVGSLAFFLIDVFYAGPHLLRLKWVMFWFVMGIVLIARIAIEIDADRAAVYGLALAMAVALVMVRFAGSPLLAWLLLAIVWWCAHQLTFDCTLIDDNDDASGEGLMQIVGLDRPPPELDRPAAPAPRSPWWRRLLLGRRAGEPHAPGLWVVYFSLAALPLFGIGQLFLPASDAQRRQYAFWCICVYVASALGLLAVTSLLGLRRYLRQRGLGMPQQMTAMWLGIAAAVAMAVLVLGSFLPRPGSSWLSSRRSVAQGPRPPASPHAVYREGTGRGAGAPGQNPSSPTRQEEPRDTTQGGPAQRGTASGQQAPARGQPPGETPTQQSTDQPRQQQPHTAQQPEAGTAGGQPDSEPSEKNRQNAGGADAGSRHDAQSGEQRQGSQAGGPSGGQQEHSSSQGGATGERQSSPSADSDTAQKRRSDAAPSGSGQPGQQSRQPPPSQRGAEQPGSRETASSPQADQGQAASGRQPSLSSTEQERSAEAGSRSPSEGRQTGSPASSPAGEASSSTWQPSSALSALGTMIKWLMYALLALAAAVLLAKNGRRLIRALTQLVADLAAFLQGWLGRRPRQASPPPAAAAPPPRPFAAFANPFLTGEAAQAQPLALTLYTYAALQAWAREQGTPPQPEQTPMEFANRVGEHHPHVAHEAAQLALVYSQTVYGRRDPDASCLPLLRRMWERLSQPQAQVASIGEG
jgi:hypothetical protein